MAADITRRTSPQKLYAFLEARANLPDEDLDALLPGVPTFMIRGALAAAGERIPQDAEQLDILLVTLAVELLAMRSDGALPADVLYDPDAPPALER